jgi:hypothetical protein
MPAKRLLLFLTVAVLLLALACKGGGGPHLPALTPFDPEGLAKLHEIRDPPLMCGESAPVRRSPRAL